MTHLERATVSSGRVGWSSASPPLRKYLLISDGEFLCAIRFVNYVRGQDASEGSIFSSGGETLTSAYEWARLERDGNRVRVTKEGKDVVKRTPLKGIGRFVIAGGPGSVQCGERTFGWEYPAAVNFSQAPNSAMALAPTRWEAIQDIRLDDAKLKWYAFEPKDSAGEKLLYVYRLLVHDKMIQPLPEDQVAEPTMRHKLAIWYSKQLPKDHPLLK